MPCAPNMTKERLEEKAGHRPCAAIYPMPRHSTRSATFWGSIRTRSANSSENAGRGYGLGKTLEPGLSGWNGMHSAACNGTPNGSTMQAKPRDARVAAENEGVAGEPAL